MESPSSPGSMDVEHHQIRVGFAGERPLHVLAVGRRLHLIAVANQELGYQVANARVVIDDQDLFLHLFGGIDRHDIIHAAQPARPDWPHCVPR